MEELKPEFTKDGSVDLRGRPVVAARTGRWKAGSFLVGKWSVSASLRPPWIDLVRLSF